MGRSLPAVLVPAGWPYDGYSGGCGEDAVRVQLSSGLEFVLSLEDAAQMRDLLNECDLSKEAR